jgi:hypothetical protein
MAVRGAAASRRRLRRRVALICFGVGALVGAALAVLGGGGAGDALVTAVLVGALVGAVGATVVAVLPTSSHGPPGQH